MCYAVAMWQLSTVEDDSALEPIITEVLLVNARGAGFAHE